MTTFTLRMTLAGYWRVATGRGDEGGADSTVLRDSSGLPCIGGRTIKGLLRHSCQELEELGQVHDGTTARLFGRSASPEGGLGRFRSEPGLLRFSSGRFPEPWQHWARGAGEGDKSLLAHVLSATALDGDRARKGSLRSFEAALPAKLHATVEVDGDLSEADEASLALAARNLRALGSARTRGFGRVRCQLQREGGTR